MFDWVLIVPLFIQIIIQSMFAFFITTRSLYVISTSFEPHHSHAQFDTSRTLLMEKKILKLEPFRNKSQL